MPSEITLGILYTLVAILSVAGLFATVTVFSVMAWFRSHERGGFSWSKHSITLQMYDENNSSDHHSAGDGRTDL